MSFRRPQFVILSAFSVGQCMASSVMIIPLLAKEHYDASPSLLGVYGFSMNLLYVAVALNMGRLCKRLGYHWVVSLGLISTILLSLSAILAPNKYALLIPCLLWGLGGGLFWPGIEGSNAEGQTREQTKRGVSAFFFSWVTGSGAGFFISGSLYQLNPAWGRWPFVLNVALATTVLLIGLLPRAFEIAPWRAAPREDEHASLQRRRLFLRLALLANFGMFLTLSAVRVLLPQYAVKAGITGFNYGLLMTASMIGYLLGNITLSAWHGWHYSGRFLIAAQAVSIAALAWFSLSNQYSILCLTQTIIGAMAGLTYFSSIYYGMELTENKGGHGGVHEAVIGLAMGLAPLIGGAIIALTGWDRSAFMAVAVFMLGSAVFQAWLMTRPPKITTGAAPAIGHEEIPPAP